MKNTLQSFVAITLVVCICVGLAWVYLRQHALSQPVNASFSHPFLNWMNSQKEVFVAYRGGLANAPENTMEAFEQAAAISPDIVLWADVRPARDGTLVLFRERDLATTTNGKGWITFETYEALSKLDAAAHFENREHQNPYAGKGVRIPLLKDVLAKFPRHRFILCFRGNQPGLTEKIIETLDAANVSDRVLVTTPEDRLIKDLREKKPTWIFGTSLAQIAQLKMLAGVGLASSAPLKGDIAVLEPEMDERRSLFHLPDGAIDEIHRRHLKLITGPAGDVQELQALRASGVDGPLLSDPTLAR